MLATKPCDTVTLLGFAAGIFMGEPSLCERYAGCIGCGEVLGAAYDDGEDVAGPRECPLSLITGGDAGERVKWLSWSNEGADEVVAWVRVRKGMAR